MRMIVFFDLPTDTEPARRKYRRFRRMLIKNGFLMMQESVYCRMVLNATVEKSVAETIKREKPSAGIVQLLTVTEKQFAAMTYITGKYVTDVVDSGEKKETALRPYA